MKNESEGYTEQDLAAFLDEIADQDRLVLADRLERGSARLEALAPRIPDGQPAPDSAEWDAHQVLAHIAVLSKFYGVLTYQIGTGRLTELDLLGQVHLRDSFGEQMAAQSSAELVEMVLSDQRRTVAYLRSASASDLRRRCAMGGPGDSMDAATVARLPLCAHLELHLGQLERALG